MLDICLCFPISKAYNLISKLLSRFEEEEDYDVLSLSVMILTLRASDTRTPGQCRFDKS